jgi:hypothetical protein
VNDGTEPCEEAVGCWYFILTGQRSRRDKTHLWGVHLFLPWSEERERQYG